MKSNVKKVIIKFNQTSIDDIKKIITCSNCKVVSFDIFDTLIKRNVVNPEDIFGILQNKFNLKFQKDIDIRNKRMKAELEAKKNLKEEINIYDIYNYFHSVSERERNWLLKEEIYLEKTLCQVNSSMKFIYDWCAKNKNLSIILTSDMYLPKKVIIEILQEAGYENWKNLYLSNEVNSTKSSGSLFKKIQKELNIPFNQIIHIGDAIKGDYFIPKSMGIKAILIQKRLPNFQYFNVKTLKREIKNNKYSYDIISSFIKNNISPSSSYYEQLGYEVMGPILYGYCKWLNKKLKENDIKKIFFLAREGLTLGQAFKYFNNKNISSKLIRVSRKATTIPLLSKCENLDDWVFMMGKNPSLCTLENLLVVCGMDQNFVNKVLKENGINSNILISQLTAKQKNKIFRLFNSCIRKKSKEQYANIRKYLNNNNFKGKVAVGDIGWHGTIQYSLQKIFPENKIKGFYIGKKSRKNRPKTLSEAYLFDDSKNKILEEKIMSSVGLFETFFLSVDGTTMSYSTDENGKVYPVLAKPEQTKGTAKNIIDLQNAAFKFVKEFKQIDAKIDIDNDPFSFAASYEKFIDPPTLKTVAQFRKFKFLSGTTQSFVSNNGLQYYVFHPRNFIKDFLNSGSKSLFLKSIFKLPLPYVKIIEFLRRFD